jgi:DNA polymerase III subunit epsilon
MLSRFFSLDGKREYYLSKAKSGSAYHDYLQQTLPKPKALLDELEFLALDFETTGLNTDASAILSVGFTVIKNMRIIMKHNQHVIVKINKPLPPKSVVIHKITDDRAQQGTPLHEVFDMILRELKNRVLLVHYAPIEREFLQAACQHLYTSPLPMRIVDTMKIEKRRLIRKNMLIGANHLRLFNIRNRYGLPRYYAHSALEDAIATAELFLVQASGMGKKLRLADVL